MYCLRLLWLLLVWGWAGLTLLASLAAWKLTRLGPRPATIFGKSLQRAFIRSGGGVLKIGQVLSSRVDLLPEETLVPLRGLQDRVPPIPRRRVHRLLLNSLGRPITELFSDFHDQPVASASIAQVHRAIIGATGEEVAVKVKRPGIAERISADVRLIRFGTRLLVRLPWFAGLPFEEAVAAVSVSLVQQIDFEAETANLRRVGELLADCSSLVIPAPVLGFCTPDVITMQFVTADGRITDRSLDPARQKAAVTTLLRALYKMIFQVGVIHCDLHPGNILLTNNGQVALVDFGFVAEFPPADRFAFAEFFLAIAFRDGRRAAEVVRSTALRVADGFDPLAFEVAMTELVGKCSGKAAGKFQIVQFVSELFVAQRRSGLYGSPNFTLAILALLTYEGIIKQLDPELDFQSEAVPFVLAAVSAAI